MICYCTILHEIVGEDFACVFWFNLDEPYGCFMQFKLGPLTALVVACMILGLKNSADMQTFAVLSFEQLTSYIIIELRLGP